MPDNPTPDPKTLMAPKVEGSIYAPMAAAVSVIDPDDLGQRRTIAHCATYDDAEAIRAALASLLPGKPMPDKEILVERVGMARTAFRIAAMTIERDVRLHELTDDEEEMLLGAAIEAAAIASMPHSEQVEDITLMLLAWENTTPRPSATAVAERIAALTRLGWTPPTDAVAGVEWFAKPGAALAFCIAVEAIRSGHEGNSIEVLCDNPEAESRDQQTAVDCCCDFTDWQAKRFYGATPLDAVLAAGIAQALAR